MGRGRRAKLRDSQDEDGDDEIRCICDKNVDRGLMIQCDKCLIWQHGSCLGFKLKDDVPEHWFCERCRKPSSSKFSRFEFVGEKTLSAQFESDYNTLLKSRRIEGKQDIMKSGLGRVLLEKYSLMYGLSKISVKDNIFIRSLSILLGVSEEEVLEYLISIADELLTFSTVEARKTNSSESDPYVGWQTETANIYSKGVSSKIVLCNDNDCLCYHFTSENFAQLGTKMNPILKRFALIAQEDIRKGSLIIEYLGQVVEPENVKRKVRDATSSLLDHDIPFVLFHQEETREICIDARRHGNLARFISYSCSPNAESKAHQIHGRVHIGIYAVNDIKKNQFISVPFRFPDNDFKSTTKCICSSDSCPVMKWYEFRHTQVVQRLKSLESLLPSSGSDESSSDTDSSPKPEKRPLRKSTDKSAKDRDSPRDDKKSRPELDKGDKPERHSSKELDGRVNRKVKLSREERKIEQLWQSFKQQERKRRDSSPKRPVKRSKSPPKELRPRRSAGRPKKVQPSEPEPEPEKPKPRPSKRARREFDNDNSAPNPKKKPPKEKETKEKDKEEAVDALTRLQAEISSIKKLSAEPVRRSLGSVGYKVALLIRYQDDLIRKSLSSPPPKNTLLLKKRFLQKLKASQPILAAPPAPEPVKPVEIKELPAEADPPKKEEPLKTTNPIPSTPEAPKPMFAVVSGSSSPQREVAPNTIVYPAPSKQQTISSISQVDPHRMPSGMVTPLHSTPIRRGSPPPPSHRAPHEPLIPRGPPRDGSVPLNHSGPIGYRDPHGSRGRFGRPMGLSPPRHRPMGAPSGFAEPSNNFSQSNSPAVIPGPSMMNRGPPRGAPVGYPDRNHPPVAQSNFPDKRPPIGPPSDIKRRYDVPGGEHRHSVESPYVSDKPSNAPAGPKEKDHPFPGTPSENRHIKSSWDLASERKPSRDRSGRPTESPHENDNMEIDEDSAEKNILFINQPRGTPPIPKATPPLSIGLPPNRRPGPPALPANVPANPAVAPQGSGDAMGKRIPGNPADPARLDMPPNPARGNLHSSLPSEMGNVPMFGQPSMMQSGPPYPPRPGNYHHPPGPQPRNWPHRGGPHRARDEYYPPRRVYEHPKNYKPRR